MTPRPLPLRPGFLMLDVLLGISIFALFVGAIGFAMLTGQEGVLGSGDRVRATLLSEQALEAARSVRDREYAALVEGTHGVQIGSGGTWVLQGTGTVTEDGFNTILTIAHEENHIALSARTAWQFGQSRSGSVLLRSELTDWRQTHAIGDWTQPTIEGQYTDDGTPLFNDAALSGDYAFVTSETSDGGAGLYVFDITNTAAPTLITTVALGAPGYDVLVFSGHLFVVTGVGGAEVEVYDIADPQTLDATDRIAAIDIAGTGRARAIAVYANTLYVSALHSATEAELYSYDITQFGSISLRDSLDSQGGLTDLSLHEAYAYLASTEDAGELRLADIFDPDDITIASGSGYNLSDVQDGQAIAAFGTFVLLGRANGSAIAELILFSIESSPVPSPPPGPWMQEMGGAVNGIDVEPAGRYAFIATESATKQLQIIDVPLFSAGSQPEAGYVATDTGDGRGVLYDFSRDRVFLLTNSAFSILKPGL